MQQILFNDDGRFMLVQTECGEKRKNIAGDPRGSVAQRAKAKEIFDERIQTLADAPRQFAAAIKEAHQAATDTVAGTMVFDQNLLEISGPGNLNDLMGAVQKGVEYVEEAVEDVVEDVEEYVDTGLPDLMGTVKGAALGGRAISGVAGSQGSRGSRGGSMKSPTSPRVRSKIASPKFAASRRGRRGGQMISKQVVENARRELREELELLVKEIVLEWSAAIEVWKMQRKENYGRLHQHNVEEQEKMRKNRECE